MTLSITHCGLSAQYSQSSNRVSFESQNDCWVGSLGHSIEHFMILIEQQERGTCDVQIMWIPDTAESNSYQAMDAEDVDNNDK